MTINTTMAMPATLRAVFTTIPPRAGPDANVVGGDRSPRSHSEIIDSLSKRQALSFVAGRSPTAVFAND